MKKQFYYIPLVFILLSVTVLGACAKPAPPPTPESRLEILMPKPGTFFTELRVYKNDEEVLVMEEFALDRKEQLIANISLKGFDYPFTVIGQLTETKFPRMLVSIIVEVGELRIDGIVDSEQPIIEQEIFDKITRLRQEPEIEELQACLRDIDVSQVLEEDLPERVRSLPLNEREKRHLELWLAMDTSRPLQEYYSPQSQIVSLAIGTVIGFIALPLGIAAGLLDIAVHHHDRISVKNPFEVPPGGKDRGTYIEYPVYDIYKSQPWEKVYK